MQRLWELREPLDGVARSAPSLPILRPTVPAVDGATRHGTLDSATEHCPSTSDRKTALWHCWAFVTLQDRTVL